jgi:hypothetical protein
MTMDWDERIVETGNSVKILVGKCADKKYSDVIVRFIRPLVP